MKKGTKIVLIGFVALIIIVLLSGTIYLIKFKIETSKMNPLETKQIINNVYVIKDDFVNMFIIKNSEHYIAIDAGINSKDILKGLSILNIDPLKVDAVYFTHAHNDHVGGISVFKNAIFYISEKEPVFSKISFKRLNDNSTMDFSGLKIQCISTPGHTNGSVSYIINDNLLFVGDTLSINNSKADVFNKFFNSNTDLQIKSIQKLKEFKNITYIISSHYGFTNKLNVFYNNFM